MMDTLRVNVNTYLVINLNQPLQCDKFVQFIKFLIKISKNIFYSIRTHEFKGIANCLSQF